MPVKINDTATLDREIARLQAKAKELEKELDDNLGYLQDNYLSLATNSIFNRGDISSNITGSVAGLLLGNKKLVDAVSKIASHLIDRAADGIDHFAEKISKKKDEG